MTLADKAQEKAFSFAFGNFYTDVSIEDKIPSIEQIHQDLSALGYRFSSHLIVCDTNTEPLARKIARNGAFCVLESGETAKTWASVERILKAAKDLGLGRDGLFIGAGGGVTGDLTAFASSIYMRGARLCLVSTTLLGMVDAAVGGKTGFDLFGIKNFAGSFYPARRVYMPLESLETLPEYEWKSGMAELLKTAILDRGGPPKTAGEDADEETFFSVCEKLREGCPPFQFPKDLFKRKPAELFDCIRRSVEIKGRIVEADPQETGTERALLNLGHTFAHALESCLGLGTVSHGEAVAWGIARSCEFGNTLGSTSRERMDGIKELFKLYGYEIASPHPLMNDTERFLQAIGRDKKKKAGKLIFIVPADNGAEIANPEPELIEKFLRKY
jgi:3-dehydroquinate synthase